MSKTKTLNPLRLLIDWGKRLVVESIARELAEDASEATGYDVEPAALDFAGAPAIEYSETD